MISTLSVKDPGFVRWPTERGPSYGDNGMTVFAVVFDHNDEYQPDGFITLLAHDVKPAPWMPAEFARYLAAGRWHPDSGPEPYDLTYLIGGCQELRPGIDVVAAVLLGVTRSQSWWFEGFSQWADAHPGRGADHPSWVATYADLTEAGRALVDAVRPLGEVHLITATDT